MPDSDPESPVSFSRFNLKPIPPRVQEVYIFGKIRAFNTFTTLEWVYLGASLVALTICLCITIARLTEEKPDESDFTFAILLLVTICFCYHYVVHSLFTECWDELMVFVVSNIIVLVYCLLNYFNTDDVKNQPLTKMVRLIIVCILSPFLIIAGIIQSYRYCVSNNLLYNTVGGISTLQNACRMFYICISLLKFDLQLQISMLILIMSKGTSLDLEKKIILGSGIPVTVIFVIVGYLGLRFESISLMVVFYILGLLDPAYIIYKIIITSKNDYDNDVIRDSTFACGYFSLVIWVLLFVSSLYFTRYYFGKGLKEKMFGNDNTAQSPAVGTVNEAVISE